MICLTEIPGYWTQTESPKLGETASLAHIFNLQTITQKPKFLQQMYDELENQSNMFLQWYKAKISLK